MSELSNFEVGAVAALALVPLAVTGAVAVLLDAPNVLLGGFAWAFIICAGTTIGESGGKDDE